MLRRKSMGVCVGCGAPIRGEESRCSVCGAVNEAGGWVAPTKSQCGNCHARLSPNDNYCRICGTKVGEGAYEPYLDLMQCIYGPMPVERTHSCPQCGFRWTTCLMIDNQDYCPKCGSRVDVEEPDDCL